MLTLRQIAQRLELPDGPDGKVNPTLRSMAGKSALIRQWAIKAPKKTTTYWIPYDRRSTATQQGIPGSAGFLDNQLTPQLSEGVSVVNQGSTVGEPSEKACFRVNQNAPERGDIHTPSLMTPVYVDDSNGWHSPSGRIPKAGIITLVDSQGRSHPIDAKRVSLYPRHQNDNPH